MPSDSTDETLYLPEQPGKLIQPDMANDGVYIEQCNMAQFEEEYDPRTFRDIPGSDKVLSPLNMGDFKKVLREIKSFITSYPDMQMCYEWWARALYERNIPRNEARGNFTLGRYALLQGLEHAKMKYRLCVEFGYLESFDGSLAPIERVRAAVFWWVQGAHCLEAILQTGSTFDAGMISVLPYLCLACVAEGMNNREAGRAFQARADQINDSLRQGRSSLGHQVAERIRDLSRKGSLSSQAKGVEVVLDQMKGEYCH